MLPRPWTRPCEPRHADTDRTAPTLVRMERRTRSATPVHRDSIGLQSLPAPRRLTMGLELPARVSYGSHVILARHRTCPDVGDARAVSLGRSRGVVGGSQPFRRSVPPDFISSLLHRMVRHVSSARLTHALPETRAPRHGSRGSHVEAPRRLVGREAEARFDEPLHGEPSGLSHSTYVRQALPQRRWAAGAACTFGTQRHERHAFARVEMRLGARVRAIDSNAHRRGDP